MFEKTLTNPAAVSAQGYWNKIFTASEKALCGGRVRNVKIQNNSSKAQTIYVYLNAIDTQHYFVAKAGKGLEFNEIDIDQIHIYNVDSLQDIAIGEIKIDIGGEAI
jgi:hypothetical protein